MGQQSISCFEACQLNRLSCSSYSALLMTSKYRADQGSFVFSILLAHMLYISNVAHILLSASTTSVHRRFRIPESASRSTTMLPSSGGPKLAYMSIGLCICSHTAYVEETSRGQPRYDIQIRFLSLFTHPKLRTEVENGPYTACIT